MWEFTDPSKVILELHSLFNIFLPLYKVVIASAFNKKSLQHSNKHCIKFFFILLHSQFYNQIK